MAGPPDFLASNFFRFFASSAFGDVYSGLQNRAIDVAELVYSNIAARKMNEVLECANETRHILLVNFQIVSEQWFQGLPEDIRGVLVEECRAAGQATSNAIAEVQEAAKQQLVAASLYPGGGAAVPRGGRCRACTRFPA